ncbi:hypothetical protein ACHHYP_20268 [Achlya hypogyna]|uniref:Tc1-like transposase DDE domain-containing protein n=1 Tax=Achlya hypogyna TaxID=1202772 RepID=A0A1V9YTX6_ACHHY|nr:hypothetical protein ACHHYP_20268 [Achlya hypogyna]
MQVNPRNAAAIKAITAYITAQRPRHLTKAEKLTILQLHAYYRGKGEKAVAQKVAEVASRSLAVVQAVWAEFKKTRKLVDDTPATNTANHATRIPNTPIVRDLVRRFIRDRCATRTRTVAKDVMAMLVKAKYVVVNVNSPKDYHACLRAVRRFIQQQGYARGRQKETSLSAAHILARNAYVRSMLPVPPGKALRLGYFRGGKQVKDYHAMFNHSYFVRWFNSLMDEVEADGHRGVVFVMDNAKYHKGKPDHTPKGTWSKEWLYLACLEYGIEVSPFDLRETMWLLLQSYVVAFVEPLVVQAAKARGHTVVYTAPNYSELQPIETVWSQVKGRVGMQYDDTTTFAMVYERLKRAFAELTSEQIDRHIGHSTTFLKNLDATLRCADDGDDDTLPHGSSSDDDTSSSSDADDNTDT